MVSQWCCSNVLGIPRNYWRLFSVTGGRLGQHPPVWGGGGGWPGGFNVSIKHRLDDQQSGRHNVTLLGGVRQGHWDWPRPTSRRDRKYLSVWKYLWLFSRFIFVSKTHNISGATEKAAGQFGVEWSGVERWSFLQEVLVTPKHDSVTTQTSASSHWLHVRGRARQEAAELLLSQHMAVWLLSEYSDDSTTR